MPIGRISDLTIETAAAFRAATHSSAPERPDDDFLAFHGRAWLEPVAEPAPSGPGKIVTGPTMALVGGSHVMQWSERDETPAELSAAKQAAIARVNRQAGEARLQFITDIPGQEGTYIAKGAEAARYATDATPDPADYPYLSAEATCTGASLSAVAAMVADTASGWTMANAAVEGLRRRAIVTIEAATTSAAVDAVFPIGWPTPS